MFISVPTKTSTLMTVKEYNICKSSTMRTGEERAAEEKILDDRKQMKWYLTLNRESKICAES